MIPRRVAFLGLAALILAAAGIAAAATHEDDEETPAALEQPAPTTTTSLPADTTTTAGVTSSTTAPATSTTATGATTTTTRQGATTTTRRGATTTTTSAGSGAFAACTTAQIEARVSTDKASYGIGETVRIHSTLHNRSATPCSYPSFVFTAIIFSPGGARVTGFDRVGEAPGALGPGQANEAMVTWERVGCTTPEICPPNTPGDYTVSATWNFPGGPYTATRTIRLT